MASRLKLEVFETGVARADPDDAVLSGGVFEEARLAAYETGYTAGWEDAVTAQGSEQSRLQAAVGRNLQELSFTYEEARSHVLRTLETLLSDMVAKVLPEIARGALAPIVLEYLRPMATAMAGSPATILLSPGSRGAVEQMLMGETILPYQIVEEPSLSDGQVYLRFDTTEQRIDLDAVISGIASAVDSFFQIEHQLEHQERARG